MKVLTEKEIRIQIALGTLHWDDYIKFLTEGAGKGRGKEWECIIKGSMVASKLGTR